MMCYYDLREAISIENPYSASALDSLLWVSLTLNRDEIYIGSDVISAAAFAALSKQ
jgi:hypothetical protein